MTLQPDGKLLIGGSFTEYNTTRRMALARLRYNGTLDTSFLDTAYNQFAGFTHPVSYLPPNYINSIALQADGNVMVGGSFTNVGGNPAARHRLRNPYTVFTRSDKRNRANVARLIGGNTPGPGNAEFDSDFYSVNENAGTVSIRMQRTDGRLGTLLGVGVTDERFASPGIDYVNSTNSTSWIEQIDRDTRPYVLPWSLGQVSPVYFRIPMLDDLLQEGDELIDLSFLRAAGSQNLAGEIVPLGGALGRSSAVLDVIDNDFPKGEFNFLLSQYVTNEFTTNAITAIIAVIRTNGSHGFSTVDYFTRNSTNAPIATANVDYERITRGQLRFGDGETTNYIEIDIINDDVIELDENVEIVLTNAFNAKLPGGTRTAIATSMLTIIDDDFEHGRLSFSSTTYTNSENENYAAVRVTRTGGSVGTVSIQYRTLNGTALNPTDYTSATGVLSWNSGDAAFKTILVPLAADGLVEGTENFRIQLFDPRVGGVTETKLFGNRTNSLVYIADSDAYGTLGFSQPYYQADENAGMVSVTVLRTAGTAGTVSVNYAAFADSAVGGVDFTPVAGTLQLSPGQTSTNFIVPLLDDPESDGNKVVRLQLSNPVGATLGVPDIVNLTLVDNESFANPPGENDRNFEQTPGANGPVYALSLYLTNGVFDGHVMIAGDFDTVNNITRKGLARLKPNSTLDQTFNPGVGPNGAIRAMLVQPDGKVVVAGNFTEFTGTNRGSIVRLNIEGTLDRFFNPGAGADGPVYALAIQPDDKLLVGGSFSRFNDQELPRLVRLDTNGVVDTTFDAGAGPLGGSGIIFAIALQPDGKVLVGGDFVQFDGVTRPGLVRLQRNGAVDLSFDAAGFAFNGPVRAIAVQPDGKIVVGGSFTIAHGVEYHSLVRLEASGALDPQFMAGLSGADNTIHALALQVDGKIVAAGDFTRFHGVTRNRITRLNPDGTTDPTINFGTGANSFISALAIQPDRKIVIGGGFTTFDDITRRRFARLYGGSIGGPGAIEFSIQPFLAEENVTNAVIVVRRRGGTTGTVSADFRTLDGTALAGRDYVATNQTLPFPQGEAVHNVFIRIIDNFTPNIDRELGLELSNFIGAPFGARPTSSLVILNDEALVGFSVTNFVTGEGDPSGIATVSVTRSLGTNTPFSVSYGIAGGTASPFFDYMPTNGTLFFNKGDLVKNFQIPILNDTNVEDTEFLNLFLQAPSPKAFLGVDRATMSILDNDEAFGQIHLSSATYTVDEAGGYVDITILRTNGSSGFVSIDVNTFNGSAIAGADYIGTNAVITFGEREKVKTLRVPILIDFLQEGSETFLVMLSNPQYGAVMVAPALSTVTILNNDRPYGTFQFSAATRSVLEGATVLPISIYRVNGSASNATVNYMTTPVNATPSLDYVQTNGTVFFPPGVTNQLIYVQILDDAIQEGTETFTMALSSPSGGSGLGGPNSTTVQIIDNDSPIIVSAGATLISEVISNGVIDAGERVTLRLGLRNTGFVNTSNLTANVQISGGVNSPAPTSATYGALVGGGAPAFRDFALTANVTNNGTLTVTLVLRDNGRDLGVVTYTFHVGAITYTFQNPSVITIRDNTSAVPYPSTIQVADIVGTISRVSVVVSNITHDYPDDMDFLLVAPSGTNVMLMSDAGHSTAIQNVTINYTDFAPSAPPDTSGPLLSGDCLPSNYGDPFGADEFVPPAPPSPYTVTRLAALNGQNANGVWSLYVYDDGIGEAGVISGGWTLTLNISEIVNAAPPTVDALGMQSNGEFTVLVRGQAGQRYTIQASPSATGYSNIHTFIMPNGGVYQYQDSVPSQMRFYRAVKSP